MLDGRHHHRSARRGIQDDHLRGVSPALGVGRDLEGDRVVHDGLSHRHGVRRPHIELHVLLVAEEVALEVLGGDDEAPLVLPGADPAAQGPGTLEVLRPGRRLRHLGCCRPVPGVDGYGEGHRLPREGVALDLQALPVHKKVALELRAGEEAPVLLPASDLAAQPLADERGELVGARPRHGLHLHGRGYRRSGASPGFLALEARLHVHPGLDPHRGLQHQDLYGAWSPPAVRAAPELHRGTRQLARREGADEVLLVREEVSLEGLRTHDETPGVSPGPEDPDQRAAVHLHG
mmetsp:Transcript_141744/g.440681  ORF Transcript_141744/g.440681 Transcript_141744/m.440681 type:complete len:291 (-) Transcript_141744:28-900(-)